MKNPSIFTDDKELVELNRLLDLRANEIKLLESDNEGLNRSLYTAQYELFRENRLKLKLYNGVQRIKCIVTIAMIAMVLLSLIQTTIILTLSGY